MKLFLTLLLAASTVIAAGEPGAIASQAPHSHKKGINFFMSRDRFAARRNWKGDAWALAAEDMRNAVRTLNLLNCRWYNNWGTAPADTAGAVSVNPHFRPGVGVVMCLPKRSKADWNDLFKKWIVAGYDSVTSIAEPHMTPAADGSRNENYYTVDQAMADCENVRR